MRFRSRFRLAALLAAAGLLPLAISGTAAAAGSPGHHFPFKGTKSVLTAAQVERLAAHATHRSIIIFKNQLSSLPAKGATASLRIQAANAAQAGVLTELKRVHATHVHSFQIINAIAATISTAEVSRLRANPLVRAVVPDALRHFASLGSGAGPIFPAAVRRGHHGLRAGATQQICPSNPAQPLIEPEARQVMNVDAANQIVNGAGIKVGIIADGIDPNNADLIRANGQHVIFDYEDFSGFGVGAPTDGREAFLDAGTIASQGNQTYDLSNFVNPAHPLPPGCNIKIEGIAPGASLAVLNVAGSNAGFFNSQIIQAVQWAVLHDHVNVLNESIGGLPVPNTQDDPVALADQAAVAAGVTVVASSGDEGPFNDIGSPATTPGVIGVGGTTTYQVYRQTTRYGTNLVPGGWENNNITALSSGGVTEFNPHTVDVVAPGDRGWSLCSTNTTEFQGCADIDRASAAPGIWAAGGTSASAPETSATAALVIEAYENAHNGTAPSPALVERIIVSTATDLGAPADHQGAGLVNTLKAVQLAESIGTSSPQGSTLLVSKTSLDATVNAGQQATFSVGVTNEGTGSQTVTPAVSGNPTTVSTNTGTVNLSTSSPTYIDGEGNTDYYAAAHLQRPGRDRQPERQHHLERPADRRRRLRDAVRPAGQRGRVLADRDEPERVRARGGAQPDRGHLDRGDLHHQRGPVLRAGPVLLFDPGLPPGWFGVAVIADAGTGAIRHVPGDRHRRAGRRRGAQAAPGHRQQHRREHPDHPPLAGPDHLGRRILQRHLTGGGQAANGGQEFTYQFNVPSGEPVTQPRHASCRTPTTTWKGSWSIRTASRWTHSPRPSSTPTTTCSGSAPPCSSSRHDRRPASGPWCCWSPGPVDGTRLSEPFTGSISFTAPAVTSSGIPNSAGTVLPAGQPVTATITVTNTGNIDEGLLRRRAAERQGRRRNCSAAT